MNNLTPSCLEIEFLSGPRDGEVVVLEAGAASIGRDSAQDLALPHDPAASARHARISREGDEIRVEDLGSEAGTFVNNSKIEGSFLLGESDVVRVGQTEFHCHRSSARPEKSSSVERTGAMPSTGVP
jgi:pSer/pThr/pTyr-binding forkhead associated (FHA) protein